MNARGQLSLTGARLRPRWLIKAAGPAACPACGRPVWPDDHAVHLYGDLYHAQCALYRREAAEWARRLSRGPVPRLR